MKCRAGGGRSALRPYLHLLIKSIFLNEPAVRHFPHGGRSGLALFKNINKIKPMYNPIGR